MKKVNVKLVTNYLALSPHSTCDEIMTGTNLSKSTVHRVIRMTPGIYRSDEYKQSPTYYIDLDEVSDGIAAGLTTAPDEQVRLTAEVQAKLDQLLALPVSEAVPVIKETLSALHISLDGLVKAEHNSQLYQSGQAQLDVVQWSKARDSMTKALLFVDTLSAYYAYWLNAPQSKTPEYWSLFPKD